MSGVIPHSAVLAEQFREYLHDSLEASREAFSDAQNSQQLRGVYKACVATFCVMTSFGKRDISLIAAAAEMIRRIPFLLASQQRPLVKVEYRRFIELVTWYPYFREHPVEWDAFQREPDSGFVKTTDTPISYCAHRERAFYSNYIKERFASEETGLVVEANNTLSLAYSTLSFFVHAGDAATSARQFDSIFEGLDLKEDTELQQLARNIMVAGCLVVAAVRPTKIYRLNAIERGWFDWLIGSARSKTIRAGAFGVLAKS